MICFADLLFSTKVFGCLDGHAFFYTHTTDEGPCMHATRDEMVCLVTKRINEEDGTVFLGHAHGEICIWKFSLV